MESGNLFKMAAKIKTERIWVRGLKAGEKQTKWPQRQTRKKLKICKNALTSHRNTAEWYSDLIFCSITFNNTQHLTTVHNLFSRCRPFSLFSFFFCQPWVPEVQFSSFMKGELFLTVSAIYFILAISRTDLWSQGIFYRSKTSAAPKFN